MNIMVTNISVTGPNHGECEVASSQLASSSFQELKLFEAWGHPFSISWRLPLKIELLHTLQDDAQNMIVNVLYQEEN